MHSIKCPDCGLVNWSSEEVCRKCGSLLSSVGGARTAANEKSPSSPWKKVLLILFVVAAPLATLFVLRKWETRHSEFSEAIQSSTFFAHPVTVEASKTSNFMAQLSPEALTLSQAGLLIVERETGMTYRTIEVPAQAGSDTDPYSHRPAINLKLPDYKPATTRLIPKNTAATAEWQTFSNDNRDGFIVPVGVRQLDKITSVEKPDTITAYVQFTWYWKPNEVGQHFDFKQARQKDPHGRLKSNPVLSSDFPYKGTAELSSTGAGWEVKSIKWNMHYEIPLLSP